MSPRIAIGSRCSLSSTTMESLLQLHLILKAQQPLQPSLHLLPHRPPPPILSRSRRSLLHHRHPGVLCGLRRCRLDRELEAERGDGVTWGAEGSDGSDGFESFLFDYTFLLSTFDHWK